MMTHHIDITTHSPDDARTLGETIGLRVAAGAVIALTGDLGSGKTTMVQGLARGLEVPKDYYVTSPTYTFINEYPGRHPLYHVDLYRLEHPDAIEDIGLFDLLGGDGVVAIEWAERLTGVPLKEHIHIHSEILGETSRRLRLSAYGLDAQNVLEGLPKTNG
jgi:tRNA threonylcarbamoyladenosine biosynthesis protein TsaE